jgi:predicted nucleic-acid-binding protein
MIGLDTNVLVRYFTQDDAMQAAQAGEVIERLSESEPGYVTMIVFVETYWVLRDAYKTDRKAIVEVLRGLLDSKEIVAERADTIRRALLRTGNGADFADSLICELGIEAGCERTVTFDRKAAKKAGMRLIT